MADKDLGEATIVYEDPDDGTIEETVENEHVAYFQDHWMIKTGEQDDGQDTVRRIPSNRVYYVERNVEEFEAEIRTLRDQVQSVATDLSSEVQTLRERVEGVAAGLQRGRSDEAPGEHPASETEPVEIEIEEAPVEGNGSASEDDVDRSL